VSGAGTFNGVTYQARVIAGIYIRILAQSRLGWFSPANDTPTAVWGETKGPGDDARIEFGGRYATSEVQAKYGLTAGAELDEVLEKIRQLADANQMPVALVLDESSTSRLYREFATDLGRLRSGRSDDLRVDARRLHDAPETRDLLPRLYVIRTDLDDPHDGGMETALLLLASVLEDKTQTDAAWAFLAQDAMDLCRQELRRDRSSLITEVLSPKGIVLRPPDKDQPFLRQIEFVRGLLTKRQPQLAMVVLRQLATDLDHLSDVAPKIRYQAATLQASAHLALGQPDEGLVSAERALDIEPNGCRALAIAARCSLALGDLDKAKALAAEAVVSDPNEARAWTATAEVLASFGEPAAVPPSIVADDREYRVTIAETAVRHGDWDRALELTAGLLHEGDRSPEVLAVRSMALADRPVGPSDSEPWHEIDRLTTEAMLAVDEDDPLTTLALTLRSAARRRMNRTDEANADIESARLLDHENPEVLRHAVEARLEADDRDGALQVLWSPATEKDPILLTLRAGVRASLGEIAEGSRDLKAAWILIPNASDPDPIRLMAAEVAVDLGDLDFAEQSLESLSDEAKKSWREPFFRGRLCFARGDIDGGSKLLREAVRRETTTAPMVLPLLGERLFRAGRALEAVEVFDEVGRPNLSGEALLIYTAALMDVADLTRAQQVVDELASQGPLPQWALAVATDIAFRREEPEAAIQSLSELVARGGESKRISIALAKALIDVDRSPEASTYIDGLLQTPDLSPIELMQAAELLRGVGRTNESVEVGFRAYRHDSGNPDMHRAFAGMVVMGGGNIPPVDVVGPDTYVRLTLADKAVHEYVVYSDPPIDPLRNEFSVEDAATKGLIGLHVDDELVVNPGLRNQERWTVEVILPASVHAAQDIFEHFADRFEGQPFFVEVITVGKNLDNPEGVAQLIGAVGEQREFQQTLIKVYREQVPPLGMIAQRLGRSMVEFMAAASSDSTVGPLVVEWSDADGQARSVETARAANSAILTRSGLETAYDLKLLEALSASMELVVPRSLLDELRIELKEAKKRVDLGYSNLGPGGPVGLSMMSLDANDPRLVTRYESVNEQLVWAQTLRVEPRPLESIRSSGSPEDKIRDRLGRSSFDAAILAEKLGMALYADDLGLRRLGSGKPVAASFSTVSLLLGLAERGAITGEQRDENLLRLVLAHYVFVSPTAELLDLAVRREPVNGRATLAQALALLAAPTISATEAARMAVAVIKAAAVRSIQTISIEALTGLALNAMATRWRMPLCASLISNEAGEQLRLLPQHQESVRRTCAGLSRG
jgi:tetratricopeptide (TPR) repeat protein